MKVLHVINAFTGGGAEKMLHDTLINQKAQGIDVDVFLLSQQNNHYLDNVKSAGVQVYISTYKSLYFPGHIKELREIMSGGYDIVHVHLFPALYWVAFASLFIKSNLKLVYTEHSTHNRRRNKFYLKFIETFIYRQYKRIFCISEATEQNLHQWVSVSSRKTVVVPNGINLQDYTDAKPYSKSDLFSDVKENDKFIVMVARFSHQKDHETLIKSLNYLDSSYKVLLVGDGEKIEDARTLASLEGVNKSVVFLGFREDIPQILKTADIFVLSSHWEGFGLVAAEAMASSLPVLVSDLTGLRDVVGRQDMTFPPGDSEKLAKKIKTILLDDDKYNEHINYGLRRSRKFSIESMVSQLKKEYIHIQM
ncbi:Glycosyltransferase involved in cell wall bisynthesis [Lentibacillus halodurans]|uniref:Glycosyltransferase involved in cell wall bisynthesis n=1 Tax=Lentibacillus halodurans TaxID=237679 RepID=A0A1I0XJ00_9BACI|nr:glycosyltransferase [Lentibacillus halodurans]SFB00982.1 Glycosyltransferase involved in cell wall bisynthesis [Lentibacillus halodurans]